MRFDLWLICVASRFCQSSDLTLASQSPLPHRRPCYRRAGSRRPLPTTSAPFCDRDCAAEATAFLLEHNGGVPGRLMVLLASSNETAVVQAAWALGGAVEPDARIGLVARIPCRAVQCGRCCPPWAAARPAFRTRPPPCWPAW